MPPTDYTPLAATFDRRYVDNDYEGIERTLAAFVGDLPISVLEVGCGTGHWLRFLASRGLCPVGVDASAVMLARARERLPDAELVEGPAEALPFADARFDRVFCVNALHHFQDRRAFLAEARRTLRQGGALLTIGLDPSTGLDRWCIYDYFEGTLAHDVARYPSASRIREEMADAGFVQCESFVAQHMPASGPARILLAEGRLDKATTSQLADLDDEAYARGVNALRSAIEVAEARGQELRIGADLRLWATRGHKP